MLTPSPPLRNSPSAFANLTPQKVSGQLRLLVVDDDPPVRRACAEIASNMGFAVCTAGSVPEARAAMQQAQVDLLLLDMKLPGGGGLTLMEEIRGLYPRTLIIVMSAFATIDSAVETMRIGAVDYLTKPFTLSELSSTLARSVQNIAVDQESRQLRERFRTGKGMGQIVGLSPVMEKLYRILAKVAATSHPVLILGESGTGKELIARSIHSSGPNSLKPFITVGCGSREPALIEVELFGCVNDTSGVKDQPGMLAGPEGSTVFLDEVGDLPLDLQARLVRALQEREVKPLGSIRPLPLTARILAATSRDLEQMVATGRFRKDLFFRLNVVNLRIPPLRERKADIPLLAGDILDKLCRETGSNYSFADNALQLMVDYEWPGNVRELEHAIERASALSSGPILHVGDFPTQLQLYYDLQQRLRRTESQSIDIAAEDIALATRAVNGNVIPIAELERQAILSTIQQLNGDKLMAAKLLGIGKTTLYRKLKEYGIEEESDLM